MSNLSDFFRGIDGAASGAPVNTIAALNLPKDINLYTDPNGGEWIRNGYFVTSSFASYPNALTSSGVSTLHVISQTDYDPADDTDLVSTNIRDFFITDDGTKLFFAADDGIPDKILQYDLSTPYDLNSRTYIRSGSVGNNELDNGFRFNSSGTVLIGSYQTGTAERWTLSSAYDVSTLSSPSTITNFSPDSGYGGQQEVSGDGNYIYYIRTTNNTVRNWGLTTSFGGTADATYHSQVVLTNFLDPFLFDEQISSQHLTKIIPNFDGTELLAIFTTTTIPISGATGTQYNVFAHFEMTTPHDLSTCILKEQAIINSYVVDSDSCFFTSDLKYSISRGDVKKTGSDFTLNVLRLDDAIGISQTQNPNIFVKIK